MYFHGKIESVFSCLDEETIKQIADTVNSCGRAMLYYNTVIETFNVADPATINDPKEVLVIAVFTQKDFEFTDTNREIINRMSNEELAEYIITKSYLGKKSIMKYLDQQTEMSTYNLAKIKSINVDENGLKLHTSKITNDSVYVGDFIEISPINGKKYQAHVIEKDNNSGELTLRFKDDCNTSISIIPKLIGAKIKLAPKIINAKANTECTIASNEFEEANTIGGVLGEGMIERRKNGGIII